MLDKKSKYITFGLGSEKYAVPIEEVQEIVRMLPVTRAQSDGRGFEGFIRLRGKVVPVYRLGQLLGHVSNGDSKLTRIIIFTKDDQLAGLIVDQVYRVAEFDTIHSVPDRPNGMTDKQLFGLGQIGDDLYGLIHVGDVW